MEAVPVFDGTWEEGLLTVLGAAVVDLVGEVMCVPSRCGVEWGELGVVESDLVVDDFVEHDKSGLLASFLERLRCRSASMSVTLDLLWYFFLTYRAARRWTMSRRLCLLSHGGPRQYLHTHLWGGLELCMLFL